MSLAYFSSCVAGVLGSVWIVLGKVSANYRGGKEIISGRRIDGS